MVSETERIVELAREVANDPFHNHLEECRHCCEHPFALCAVGRARLDFSLRQKSLKSARENEAPHGAMKGETNAE